MGARTPGPWRVSSRLQVKSEKRLVADIITGYIPEAEANARFIAAAPDMEKALEVISGSPHGANCDGFDGRRMRFQCSCHVLIAKAAIAKAK